MTGGFRVVAYEPSLRPALFELMESVWGSYMSEREFEWWYERNPLRRGTITLAQAGGRIVGMLAMSYALMRERGRDRLVAFAIDGATHPDYRGRGIFRALELENEERAADAGAEIAIGFTNPQAGPILVGRVGWRDVRRLRLWARVLRPLALLRRRGGGGSLARPAGGGRVRAIDRFGAEAAELAARATRRGQLVRDEEYLNWRYAASPREYRCFGTFRGGRLAGFAVLGHKVYRGISAGYVADLVAPAPDDARALLRRCVREAREADAVIALPAAHGRAYLSAAFVPTHETIRLIAKPLAQGARLPQDGREWNLVLGDSDIF